VEANTSWPAVEIQAVKLTMKYKIEDMTHKEADKIDQHQENI
jgi:hypothetical protein